MFKKTKHGIEIDSQEADKGMTPSFKKGKRPTPSYIEQPKRESAKAPAFGKKKARKGKIAALIGKAKK